MDHAAERADRSSDDRQPGGVPARSHGPVDSGQALWDDLRRLAHELQMAARATPRPGEILVPIIVYGIVVGVLIAIALLGAAGAMVLYLVR